MNYLNLLFQILSNTPVAGLANEIQHAIVDGRISVIEGLDTLEEAVKLAENYFPNQLPEIELVGGLAQAAEKYVVASAARDEAAAAAKAEADLAAGPHVDTFPPGTPGKVPTGMAPAPWAEPSGTLVRQAGESQAQYDERSAATRRNFVGGPAAPGPGPASPGARSQAHLPLQATRRPGESQADFDARGAASPGARSQAHPVDPANPATRRPGESQPDLDGRPASQGASSQADFDGDSACWPQDARPGETREQFNVRTRSAARPPFQS